MRGGLEAGPELEIRRLRHTLIYVGLAAHQTDRVVDEAVDAVRGSLAVAGAKVVDVVCEGAILDAAHHARAGSRWASSVAAESGYRVQDDRVRKVTCVAGLVPVSCKSQN